MVSTLLGLAASCKHDAWELRVGVLGRGASLMTASRTCNVQGHSKLSPGDTQGWRELTERKESRRVVE